MRLVLAGHDYAAIKSGWNLGMVLRANTAMDIQAAVDRKAHKSAVDRAKRDQNARLRGNN